MRSSSARSQLVCAASECPRFQAIDRSPRISPRPEAQTINDEPAALRHPLNLLLSLLSLPTIPAVLIEQHLFVDLYH